MSSNLDFKIIAETAFSHEGDYNYLLSQIDAAVTGNADYVKFQVLLDPAGYFSSKIAINDSKKHLFSEEEWQKVFDYSKDKGLGIIALPLENRSANFCAQNSELIDKYEIHSVCFFDYEIAEILKITDNDILLGVGGRHPKEISDVAHQFAGNRIILMTGFQAFPTELEYAELGKIKQYKDLFRYEVGYADHSTFEDDSYLQLNEAALFCGATFFEKHIVVEKGRKRIDYESAVSVKEFIKMRERLEVAEKVMGKGNVFNLNSKEQKYREREKAVVYKSNFKCGHILTKTDICLRVATEKSDFSQCDYRKLIGEEIRSDVEFGEPVKFKHIGGL